MTRGETIATPADRIPALVLGATGLVGQRLVAMLVRHPWFRLAGVAASERHAGWQYGEVVPWRIEGAVPTEAAAFRLARPTPDDCPPAPLVFSALPALEAEAIEPAFARAGAFVSSNASAFRMASDVPLVIPEINPDHLAALASQCAARQWSGALVTNPNCSTIGLALALAPLARFGIEQMMVTTLQAASGAGYPGVASLDLIDNVIPFIAGEEEKIETETRKILGAWQDGSFVDAPIRLSAQTTRVPVREGHLACVSIKFAQMPQPEDILAAWQEFSGLPQTLKLPTAPEHVLRYLDAPDRPQPRYDRDAENGMGVTLGRLRR
ncbi:MAG TPA: aspartate-semialdehyde dehydrogenase, partial [Ktedonobacterales bacterium]|nr:aspartate-semialdehyde dehydrogenase [Ktedonobacterales bacterium]